MFSTLSEQSCKFLFNVRSFFLNFSRIKLPSKWTENGWKHRNVEKLLKSIQPHEKWQKAMNQAVTTEALRFATDPQTIHTSNSIQSTSNDHPRVETTIRIS